MLQFSETESLEKLSVGVCSVFSHSLFAVLHKNADIIFYSATTMYHLNKLLVHGPCYICFSESGISTNSMK